MQVLSLYQLSKENLSGTQLELGMTLDLQSNWKIWVLLTLCWLNTIHKSTFPPQTTGETEVALNYTINTEQQTEELYCSLKEGVS